MKLLILYTIVFGCLLNAQESKTSKTFALPKESQALLRQFLQSPDVYPASETSPDFRALYGDMARRLLLDDRPFRIQRRGPESFIKHLAAGVISDEFLPKDRGALGAPVYLKDVDGDKLADWERIEHQQNGIFFRVDSGWDRVLIVAYTTAAANQKALPVEEVLKLQQKCFHFPPKPMVGQTGVWWNQEPQKPSKGLQPSHFRLVSKAEMKGLWIGELHGPFPEQTNYRNPLRIDSPSSWKTTAPVLSDGRFFAVLASYWELGLSNRSTPIVGYPDRW